MREAGHALGAEVGAAFDAGHYGVGLVGVCGIGVFGALSAAGAANDVLDFGDAAEEVFDAVVEAIHFVERGFGGEDGLH